MNKDNIYKNISKENKMLELKYGVSLSIKNKKTGVISGVRKIPETVLAVGIFGTVSVHLMMIFINQCMGSM